MKFTKVKRFIMFLIISSTFFALFPQDAFSASKLTIVIDPGHGGIDTGAMKKGIYEKDITLDISKRLQKILNSKGYNVILTRKSDITLSKNCKIGDTRQLRDLNARVATINNSGAKLFLSIHVNSAVQYPRENGSITFYWGTSAKSKALASNIQRALNTVSLATGKRKSHNPESSDFYVLKKTQIPGVLVETGFLSNTAERKMLAKSSFKQKIANNIAKGLENYLKSR